MCGRGARLAGRGRAVRGQRPTLSMSMRASSGKPPPSARCNAVRPWAPCASISMPCLRQSSTESISPATHTLHLHPLAQSACYNWWLVGLGQVVRDEAGHTISRRLVQCSVGRHCEEATHISSLARGKAGRTKRALGCRPRRRGRPEPKLEGLRQAQRCTRRGLDRVFERPQQQTGVILGTTL